MKKLLLSFILCLATLPMLAASTGWPSQYKGVMLQAFYWNSYGDTRWVKLTDQAEQMCYSFDLVWIPQPGKPSGSPSMGYDPVYWISNWSSSFGNESELKSLISTFKEKNTGIIVDMVLNHKAGVSSDCDFPNETVGSYSIQWPAPQSQWVVSGDNGVGTGNADTGEDFSGYCDLDHTKAKVQTNCKTYCKFMIDQMGFAGFRLDMVKGYSASYTQTYNNYANVNYCIGEYWDGSYDAVVNWINGTGKTSAAFDFPLYYGAMQRFNDGNFAGDFSNKGMCGDAANGMQRYAITFVDNHDTYQKNDTQHPIKKNVEAANAFILALPGTPCIFLPHWKQYKSNIQKMIAARKAAGLHNQSSYTEGHAGSGYWIETVGTSCNILALFGSITIAQAGKTSSQYKLVASGTNFKYYIKNTSYTNPTFPDYTPSVPENFYLLGDVQGWSPTDGLEMTKSGDSFTWEGTLPGSGSTYFSFTSKCGEWDDIAGYRFGASSDGLSVSKGNSYPLTEGGSNAFKITPGDYKLTVTFSNGSATLKIEAGNPTPQVDVELPEIATYVEGKQFCYFEKPDTYLDAINVWAWKRVGSTDTPIYASWPGSSADVTYVGNTPTAASAPMQEVDGPLRAAVGSNKRLYRWVNSTSTEITHIIFTDKNTGTHQTSDLTFENGAYYQGNTKLGVVSQTTGISEVNTETTEAKQGNVYTLDGRIVNEANLPKGIYVKNGKKFVVK